MDCLGLLLWGQGLFIYGNWEATGATRLSSNLIDLISYACFRLFDLWEDRCNSAIKKQEDHHCLLDVKGFMIPQSFIYWRNMGSLDRVGYMDKVLVLCFLVSLWLIFIVPISGIEETMCCWTLY